MHAVPYLGHRAPLIHTWAPGPRFLLFPKFRSSLSLLSLDYHPGSVPSSFPLWASWIITRLYFVKFPMFIRNRLSTASQHARMTCTYCMDVHTLVEQLYCIQLLRTRAHAEQGLRGRLTFPFLISFFLDIHLDSPLLDLFVHEVLLVYSLFFNVASFFSAVTH